jgi:hypothetical protein
MSTFQTIIDISTRYRLREEDAEVLIRAAFPDYMDCSELPTCSCSFCTRNGHDVGKPQPEAEYLRDQMAWIASLPEWKRILLTGCESDIMAELDRLEA